MMLGLALSRYPAISKHYLRQRHSLSASIQAFNVPPALALRKDAALCHNGPLVPLCDATELLPVGAEERYSDIHGY
jgi:hypothetical protein